MIDKEINELDILNRYTIRRYIICTQRIYYETDVFNKKRTSD